MQTYKIPETDKIIEEGVAVIIPVFALHHDEQYYENPETFNPDRFVEQTLPKNVYIPFGDGPRNCIGMRLAKVSVKVGLALMLQKFRFEVDAKIRDIEIKFDPASFVLAPAGRISLHTFKR